MEDRPPWPWWPRREAAPLLPSRGDPARSLQPLVEFARLDGPLDEVALGEVAAEGEDEVPFDAALDALGHRGNAKLLRHLEARLEHRPARLVRERQAHERLVDLQLG